MHRQTDNYCGIRLENNLGLNFFLVRGVGQYINIKLIVLSIAIDLDNVKSFINRTVFSIDLNIKTLRDESTKHSKWENNRH